MEEKKAKKPESYQKPHIEAIDLKTDEVLAGGCKTASADAPGSSGGQCDSGTACVDLGS